MIKAGDNVHVKFAGLSFEGKVTRVGADKGEKTKVQIQNTKEGGKPLWYPLSAITIDEEDKVYTFWFAGAKKQGTIVEEKGDKVVMKTTGNGASNYTVKKSDVEFEIIDEAEEKAHEDAMVENQEIGEENEKLPNQESRDEEARNEEGEQEPEKVKTTIFGEAVIAFLQKNTEQSDDVQCKTVDEISDAVGKTQPQVKAALNALNDLGLVLIGVCSDNPNTAALTPDGFIYLCGEPVEIKKLSKDGKKVTKKERIIALYYQGLSNKEITEQVGCDASYPSWLIKEEIAKGNIKPRD